MIERRVVIEFNSVEVALAAYDSAEYEAAFELLANIDRDVRVIEGA